MGKAPCCSKVGLHKGPWSTKEDNLLTNYIQVHGEGQWRSLPKKAGLLRCGKSCRLRWMNYLRPGIKRGNITTDEEDLIIRLHSLLGNRWSLIAGRLPGRTDNEIKNYWNTHLVKRLKNSGTEPKPNKSAVKKSSKEPKKKARAAAPETTTTTMGTSNKKKKQKIDSNAIVDDNSGIESGDKIKVYAPKPIRIGPGFSSNNNVDSGLSSSSSNEEVNKEAANNDNNKAERCNFDQEAEMAEFDWPLIELGDSNYGNIQVYEDDQVLIETCDFFSPHDSTPTISNMLEQVYDEYLQLL